MKHKVETSAIPVTGRLAQSETIVLNFMQLKTVEKNDPVNKKGLSLLSRNGRATYSALIIFQYKFIVFFRYTIVFTDILLLSSINSFFFPSYRVLHKFVTPVFSSCGM